MTGFIPAATLVLLREPDHAAPELLMVERAAIMAFAGGALVFPGGRVDPGDRALAARFPALDADDAAARIAAIRETLEETGIAVALDPAPDAPAVAALRQALAAGEDFGALLGTAGIVPDPTALVAFARWRPDFHLKRTFDTRFYLARTMAEAEPVVDGTENVTAFWRSAADILASDARVIFPTRRNLERLAGFASFAAAAADAALHPVETITPWIEQRDGEAWLCIPADAGYPVTAQRHSEVLRG